MAETPHLLAGPDDELPSVWGPSCLVSSSWCTPSLGTGDFALVREVIDPVRFSEVGCGLALVPAEPAV